MQEVCMDTGMSKYARPYRTSLNSLLAVLAARSGGLHRTRPATPAFGSGQRAGSESKFCEMTAKQCLCASQHNSCISAVLKLQQKSFASLVPQ